MVPLSFAGQEFLALPEAALYWPAQQALLVADLHFEKASWYARFGQFLPPHDSAATLDLIEALVARTGATRLWSLGDSFHDAEGAARLDASARARLAALTGRLDWIWITGNHDPDPPTHLGGQVSMEFALGPITFRHIAKPQANMGEVSGHYHPKARVSVRGQYLSAPCFITDGKKLILPAFGAYTGGLDVTDPAIDVHFKKGYNVHLLGQQKVFSFPKNALSKKRRHEANMIL